MKRSASSIEASSFLACQFAMADKRSFSNFCEASFELNLNIFNALSIFSPLTISAIRRIFLGDVGQLFNLAIYKSFLASLILSALSLLRTPIVYYLLALFLAPA